MPERPRRRRDPREPAVAARTTVPSPRNDTGAAHGELCAVRDALAVLQGKWTLQIVRALLAGPRGFNDLARAVGGCNPATLSKRLEALAEIGLLTKRIDSTMPPRTCYTLTRAGHALEEVIGGIERWGARYLTPPEGARRGAMVRSRP